MHGTADDCAGRMPRNDGGTAAVGAPGGRKILFLGGLYPEEIRRTIYSDSLHSVDSAADALQNNMLEGLRCHEGTEVRIVSSAFIGSYPRRYRRAVIGSFDFVWKGRFPGRHVGFLNVSGVKRIVRAIRIGREVSRSIARQDALVAYSCQTELLLAIRSAKRTNPSLTTCLIVPDLPEFMDLSRTHSSVYRILKWWDRVLQKRLLPFVDVYALLTAPMADRLGLRPDQYVVIEGVANAAGVEPATGASSAAGEKTVCYTGTLTLAYGVKDLVDGFMKTTNPDYRLWICGGGEGAALVRECATVDRRIRYWGQLDRASSVAMQARATVVINPRGPQGEYTKYSFPSKLMEYMLSGRPAIAAPLPGIPAEYTPYYFPLIDASPTGIAETLDSVLSLSEEILADRGARARDFVRHGKNPRVQAAKLLRLLETAGAAGRKERAGP